MKNSFSLRPTGSRRRQWAGCTRRCRWPAFCRRLRWVHGACGGRRQRLRTKRVGKGGIACAQAILRRNESLLMLSLSRCCSCRLTFVVTRVLRASLRTTLETATWRRPPNALAPRPGVAQLPLDRRSVAGRSRWRPRVVWWTRVTWFCRLWRRRRPGRGAAATTRPVTTAGVPQATRPSTCPSTGSSWSAVRVSARRRWPSSSWRQSSWPHRTPASVSNERLYFVLLIQVLYSMEKSFVFFHLIQRHIMRCNGSTGYKT